MQPVRLPLYALLLLGSSACTDSLAPLPKPASGPVPEDAAPDSEGQPAVDAGEPVDAALPVADAGTDAEAALAVLADRCGFVPDPARPEVILDTSGGADSSRGCGSITGISTSENGLLAIGTEAGAFVYDTGGKTFFGAAVGGQPLSLSADGSLLFAGRSLYSLGGGRLERLASVPDGFSPHSVNGTLDYVSGSVSETHWQVLRSTNGEVVLDKVSQHRGEITRLSPSGKYVVATVYLPTPKRYTLNIYREGVELGSWGPRYYETLHGWLTEDLVAVSPSLGSILDLTDPTFSQQPLCAERAGKPSYGATDIQLLSERRYLAAGVLCEYGEGASMPPSLPSYSGALLSETAPGRLIGDLAVYVGNNEVAVKPWR